jgi:DNA-directed RNA polymerase specialized sigma24 family protein
MALSKGGIAMTAEEKQKHRQEQIARRAKLKKRIVDLYDAGYKAAEIAGLEGLPESTVRAILKYWL